jgi:dolichol-phosphate mannosyltransferase
MTARILIVLPTYNEAGFIEKHLNDLDVIRKKISKDFDITILNVDDSSPDGTALLALNLALPDFHQIKNRSKNGLGPAYLAGFAWGLARDFNYFVEMDSDGSHLPGELINLLNRCFGYDLVIGARWIPGGKIENWPWYRVFISKLGTSYASRLLKLPIMDLTSGYRILSRELLESLDLDSISTRGYGFQIEMALQAYTNGFAVTEVPITFVERSLGKSKMTVGIVFEAFRYVTKRGFERILLKDNRR